jgi:hypothetical protein
MGRGLLRVGIGVALAVGLVAATGAVMLRNRKMSLFLRARDRIERGDPSGPVLAELRRSIDWAPASRLRSVAFALRAAPDLAGAARPLLYRAGDWALLVAGEHLALFERTRRGWREVPRPPGR